MSYASAVRSGISPTHKTVRHQAPAPPPQLPDEYEDEIPHLPPPLAEEEIQEGPSAPMDYEEDADVPSHLVATSSTSLYGKELVGIESTGYLMLELNAEYEDEFWTMLVIHAGPMGLCNLGVSCRYFCGKFFSTPTYWELVASQAPITVQPSIKFFVDFSPDGGPEDAPLEKVQTVPLSQVKTEPKKQQLGKYWLRTVTKAVAARDSKLEESKRDDPLAAAVFRKPDINAVLPGGFVIETLHPKQKLVQLRDLKQVLVWLKAIDETLLAKKPPQDMFVNIPFEHGRVSLRRVGRGGTEILVKVVEGKETRVALYTLDSFLLDLYSVSEEYLSILVYCKNSFIAMGQRVPSKLAESWKANEDYILKNATGMDGLSRVLNSIKEKLSHGFYIPRSSLPEAFRTLQALHQKRKDDEASTNDNISDFVYDNLPLQWEETKRAALQIAMGVKSQRDREFSERAARREHDRQAKRAREAAENNDKRQIEKVPQSEDKKDKKDKKEGKSVEQKVVKPKTKTVKLTSSDGFITVKTVAEGEDAKFDEEVVEEPVTQQVPKKKKKLTNAASENLTLKSNPYAVVLQDVSYETQELPPPPKSIPNAPTKNAPAQSKQAKKIESKQTTKPKPTDKQPTEPKKLTTSTSTASGTSKKSLSTSSSSDTKSLSETKKQPSEKQPKEKKEKPEKKEKKEKTDKKDKKDKKEKKEKKDKKDKKATSSKKQQKAKLRKHDDEDDSAPKFAPIPPAPTPIVSGGKKGKKGTQAQLLQLLNHDLFKPVAMGAVVVVIAAIVYTVYLS